jgi:hypothetical protein
MTYFSTKHIWWKCVRYLFDWIHTRAELVFQVSFYEYYRLTMLQKHSEYGFVAKTVIVNSSGSISSSPDPKFYFFQININIILQSLIFRVILPIKILANWIVPCVPHPRPVHDSSLNLWHHLLVRIFSTARTALSCQASKGTFRRMNLYVFLWSGLSGHVTLSGPVAMSIFLWLTWRPRIRLFKKKYITITFSQT